MQNEETEILDWN